MKWNLTSIHWPFISLFSLNIMRSIHNLFILQAYLMLCFALLYFAYDTFYFLIDWKFVTNLHGLRILLVLFSTVFAHFSLSSHFGDFHPVFTIIMEIYDQWSWYYYFMNHWRLTQWLVAHGKVFLFIYICLNTMILCI